MNEYIAISNQNFFDLVLALYGGLDGISDLLSLNEWLSPDYICKGGELVIYNGANVINQPVVSYYNEKNITPINGTRGVFHKVSPMPLIAEILVPSDVKYISISFSGYGEADVDFGDNSIMLEVKLDDKVTEHINYFNTEIDCDRKIRVYSDGQIDTFMVKTDKKCLVSAISDVIVSNIYIKDIDYLNNINFSSIFKRVRRVDVSNIRVKDISGLYWALYLNEINLNNCRLSQKTIDDYLIYICKNYSTRVAAVLNLEGNELPSGIYSQPADLMDPKTGMEAVWVLVNDENRGWTVKFGNRHVHRFDANSLAETTKDVNIDQSIIHSISGGDASTEC